MSGRWSRSPGEIARDDPRRIRDDVQAELHAHFEGTVELLMSRGWTEEEARREARRRFGSLDRYRQELERMGRRRRLKHRLGATAEALGGSVGHALRAIRRSPGFSAAVVVTLALGVGANAATFRVVDSLLLSPPPHIERPSEVRRLHQVFAPDGGGPPITFDMFTYTDVDAVRASALAVEIAGWYGGGLQAVVGEGEQARRVRAARVDSAFFPLLGTRPLLGRGFLPEDHQPDAPPVALLSHAFWTESLGGDRAVIGREIRAGEDVRRAPAAVGMSILVGEIRHQVVGVLPPGFVGPHAPAVALWLPLGSPGLFAEGWRHSPTLNVFHVLARIAPGVEPESLVSEAETVIRRHRAEHGLGGTRGELQRILTSSLVPGDHPAPGPAVANAMAMTRWLLAVSLLVLLVACANVANLFLAQGERTARETVVRLALGAGRARLAAELLMRSLLLALLGAGGALVLAVYGGALLEKLFLAGVAPVDLRTGRTLMFTAAAGLLAATAAGALPALRAARSDLRQGLEGGGRGVSGSGRLRRTLVATQAALSAVLLVGASLFVLSFSAAAGKDLGFEAGRLLRVTWDTDFEAAARQLQLGTPAAPLHAEVEALLRSLPGVASASLADAPPFPRAARATEVRPSPDDGGPEALPAELPGPGLDVQSVGADFLTTLGVAVLRGRDVGTLDVLPGAEPVIVVSRGVADRLWPGEDPLGRCLAMGEPPTCARVVGVAAGHATRLTERPELQAWTPLRRATGLMAAMVRVEGEPGATAMAETIRRQLLTLPRMRHVEVTPMREVVADEMRTWRLGASVFSLFGLIALGVAGVGLYALLAYDVAQRRREIGIRIALGARGGRVIRHVLSSAALTVGTGLAAGLGLSLWAAGRLESLLFEVSPRDPAVFALAAAALLLIAATAAAVPAWRATRVDPRESLAAE